jgi:hypothetical protein
MNRRLPKDRTQRQSAPIAQLMPVLRIPRVDQHVQLLVAHQVQLERLVPVKLQIARSHHRPRFMDSVTLQHTIQVAVMSGGGSGLCALWRGSQSSTGQQVDPQHSRHAGGVKDGLVQLILDKLCRIDVDLSVLAWQCRARCGRRTLGAAKTTSRTSGAQFEQLTNTSNAGRSDGGTAQVLRR